MFAPFMPSGLKSENTSSGLDLMMLAPWVIAMRMPELAYEAVTPWHAVNGRRGGEGEMAVTEKTAAIVESYGVVQAEIFNAWNKMMSAAMVGQFPDPHAISRSVQDFSDATMEPMAKRVRANYRRLKKA